MMIQSSIPLVLLALPVFAVLCTAQDFDFFYFVQQWPGSYCDTKQSCCYPTTGKPLADFGIHGLWPNNNDGSYPSNCDSHNPFKSSEIKELIGQMQKHWPTLACPSNDGLKFWGHEWNKHGTCSESVLDQHSYFETALRLQKETNLLEILRESGIRPGGFYSLDEIKEAIKEGLGFAPGIECNRMSRVPTNCIRFSYVLIIQESRSSNALCFQEASAAIRLSSQTSQVSQKRVKVLSNDVIINRLSSTAVRFL
uniref:Uncharacterized protein n=1 Tax=Ananas comosus var. bracteatus TaxID=296719 RepID=A0A6V7QUN2_ANACO